MKKKIIILAVVLMAAALCAEAFAENLKIGMVDMRKVFYEYNKTKNFNDKLEKEDTKAKAEIDKKREELKKLRDEMEMMSDQAREKKQTELRDKAKALDEFARGKADELLRKKDDMFKEIRGDIMNVSSKYATKNGYDMLLDNAVFVYATDKYDVTNDIIKELNR